MGKYKRKTSDPKNLFSVWEYPIITCSVRTFCYYSLFIKAQHWVANNIITRETTTPRWAGTFKGAGAALEGWLHDLLGWAVPRASTDEKPAPWAREGDTDRSPGCGSPCLAQLHPPVGLLESHQHLPAELQLEPPSHFMAPVTRVQSHEVFHMQLWEPERFVGSPWVTASLSGQGPACQLWCSNTQTEHRHLHRGSFVLQIHFTLCIC